MRYKEECNSADGTGDRSVCDTQTNYYMLMCSIEFFKKMIGYKKRQEKNKRINMKKI